MKIAGFRVMLIVALVIGAADSLFAQRVTVQQPVVQVFSVDTVVSVPDRGSAFLGGVSSAAEGRGTYGLFPLGSNTGLRRTHTAVEAGVYIHDFEAMDEYLLSRPSGRERNTWVNPNARAAAAFDSMSEGRFASAPNRNSGDAAAGRTDWGGAGRATRSQPSGPPQTDDRAELAEFYLKHARDTEQRDRGVAMLCYRMAARYGSSLAEEKLREMGGE